LTGPGETPYIPLAALQQKGRTVVVGEEGKVGMAKRIEEALTAASEQVQSARATAETMGKRIAAGSMAGWDKTQAEVKTNMDKAIKTTEELVAFGQDYLEACMKANQIWAAGVQDLSKTVAASAQARLEEGLATMKALAGVKSLKDAADLQAAYARTSFDKAMADNSKLTEAGLKLAEQYWAPLTARMTQAVEKFGHPV
jgi:phasin family protein